MTSFLRTNFLRTRLPNLASPASCSRIASTTRLFSSAAQLPPSEKDPSHPHLWYHPSSSYISLSFLPTKPAVYGSKTVIGYLPLGEATLDDFRNEPKFEKVLEDAVKDGLAKGKATTVEFEAETRPTDGWIHITDERAIPPMGRIGETEDIIGSVYVQEGKIIADTYSASPTYRLVTTNGVLRLPRGLDEHLVETLKKFDEEERRESAASVF
ncbi:hypothetical protein, variant [Cryptococcus amylolentus CBS 6039]|uniref:Uncharacterized protein n=2 Tax=Cryptococcus amylolentus TaxID=104669 RepID=A0A1E3HTH0_9TREE|nr:hypothetical protein, variant [Cryptococcus amylolentus CBS 6039]ODN79649.1 hypothetical protein, variant [Cryptococcus amylolentus CBS 6039]ODO07964.1 hypothetical protein I350_03547 [Cryptococcus amylolentus CBS 6273]